MLAFVNELAAAALDNVLRTQTKESAMKMREGESQRGGGSK